MEPAVSGDTSHRCDGEMISERRSRLRISDCRSVLSNYKSNIGNWMHGSASDGGEWISKRPSRIAVFSKTEVLRIWRIVYRLRSSARRFFRMATSTYMETATHT